MNRRITLIAITLILCFGLRIWLSAVPTLPRREQFSTFPKQAGSWIMAREDTVDDATASVLQADDYLIRQYRDGKGRRVDLFIAYYKTQKAGESMHSPMNCLPGAGWGIVEKDKVSMDSEIINRYLIEKNGDRALVLYWYQANGRVIANEYWGKFYLVLDALRTGRSDGAIVRFVVPIPKGSNGNSELQSGMEMARSTFPLLPSYLPN
jgi:EpsI family protein